MKPWDDQPRVGTPAAMVRARAILSMGASLEWILAIASVSENQRKPLVFAVEDVPKR